MLNASLMEGKFGSDLTLTEAVELAAKPELVPARLPGAAFEADTCESVLPIPLRALICA